MPAQLTTVSDIIKELGTIRNPVIDDADKFESVTSGDGKKTLLLKVGRSILAGDGKRIIVSEKIDQLIDVLAHDLQAASKAIATSFTMPEWRTLVRDAFGPALLKINHNDDLTKSAEAVLSDVLATVTKKAGWHSQMQRDHVFGCTLFGNPDVSGFAIGPVRFEPRLEWLDRKEANSSIPAITARRLKRVWQGGKIRKRKSGIDSVQTSGIIDTIGNCPYVCTVSTRGFGEEASMQNALTVARLALTSIALPCKPTSHALNGFNLSFDHSTHLHRWVVFAGGKVYSTGSRLSHMPHGPYVKPDTWRKELAAGQHYFAVCARILEYFLGTGVTVSHPKIMNALAQALLWFHEACREPIALMAIVKFSASLDALASGRKSAGILRVLDSRLGMKSTDIIPFDSGGANVKEAIGQIYSDGRSRTIHGTNEKLGYDWSRTRGLAEYLASSALMSCIEWAADECVADDPLLLMR